MDLTQIDPETLGVVGILLLILVAGYKRYWVWGVELTTMEKDRDWWRNAALTALGLAERTQGTTERVIAKPDLAGKVAAIYRDER